MRSAARWKRGSAGDGCLWDDSVSGREGSGWGELMMDGSYFSFFLTLM